MTKDVPTPACAYCGLPVSGGRMRTDAEVFCCFGCRFAADVTRGRGAAGQLNGTLTRLGLAIFFTLNVMVFTMALWTQDFYPAEAGPEAAVIDPLRGLFRYLSLLTALPVLFLLGGPLAESAWAELRRRRLTSDLLLVLGVFASYLYSAVSVARDRGAVYFEVGCMVLLLVTLGRWLEASVRLKTSTALEGMHTLLPERVRVLSGDREELVALDDVTAGDRLRVQAGERIPGDGRVLLHEASVDEQGVTGESRPVVKKPGERVFGGTLDLDGDLVIELTAAPHAGTLARLLALVRQARATRGPYEQLADRVSAWFLPAVVVVALVAAGWHAWSGGMERGLLVALAVVLISCPCALGLATPLAVWSGLGQAARGQVLFRNAEALERLAFVRAVRFDKTGTLTTGSPEVCDFVADPEADRGVVLREAARLAAVSMHGYSQALVRYAAAQCAGAAPPTGATGVRALPGRGLLTGGDRPVLVGSPRLMGEYRFEWPPQIRGRLEEAERAGESCTCVGWDGRVRGLLVFREQLRPEAARALDRLRSLGLDVVVLTGDHAARGAAVARELKVPVQSGLLPEDKVRAVEEARRTVGPVAMVGDGLNDAPALATSDVGVALGCGADVSRDAAAVCLQGDDLLRLPWAVELARGTVSVVRQNLFWAFAYNVVGIGFACAGALNPVLAAAAMVLSSLVVIGNTRRLDVPPAGATTGPIPASPRPEGVWS